MSDSGDESEDEFDDKINRIIHKVNDVFGSEFMIANDFNREIKMNIIIQFLIKEKKDKENDNDLSCLEFTYDPDVDIITINKLSKCGTHSGTYILKKMIKVFNDDNHNGELSMIIGSDKAMLNQFPEISLSWLYLFKNGETWYNSKGFKEDDYNTNSRIINEFITQKASPFYETDEEKQYSSDLTIQQVFIKIFDDLKTNENSDISFYKHMIDKTISLFKTFLQSREYNEEEFNNKFINIPYIPDEVTKGGRKTRKRHVTKRKNTIKRKKCKKHKKSKKSKKSKKNKRHKK